MSNQEQPTGKTTIADIEAILDKEEDAELEILPNGEVRVRGEADTGERKPLTMRESLGGEYGNPKIVIADLDGTIALIDHRREWLDPARHPELSSDERWRMFFKYCVFDKPNLPVIQTLNTLAEAGYEIHIFSGRSDEVRRETEHWLWDHNVRRKSLRMRAAGDFTKDEILKRQWIEEYDLSEILCVFDDRSCVVEMWRELGLSCFQVAPGDF